MLQKEKIQRLVGQAKIREALQMFLESLSSNDSVSEDDITMLSSQLSSVEKEETNGIINNTDAVRRRNAVGFATLNLLKNCTSDDSTSLLEKAINKLPVDKDADLGKLQLLNCNRDRPVKRFNKVFEKKKTAAEAFQFYFLCGCPDEMPSSLAERVLYEIIEEESTELKNGVCYPYHSEADFRRVTIENLPFSLKGTTASAKLFKEYIQKRFEFNQNQDFEAFIEKGIPQLQYSHVATIFRIEETKWKEDEGEIVEYLHWLSDVFKNAHANVPTFVFLFIIEIKKLYDENKVHPRTQKILTQLEKLCEEKNMTLLDGILPVEEEDLQTWFSSNLKILNRNFYQPVIDAFIQSLAPQDLVVINDERRFHIKDFEPIQAKIIHTFRKRATSFEKK